MIPKHWLWAITDFWKISGVHSGVSSISKLIFNLNTLLIILTLLGIALLSAYGIEKNQLTSDELKNLTLEKVKLVGDLQIAGIAIFPSGFLGLIINISLSAKIFKLKH